MLQQPVQHQGFLSGECTGGYSYITIPKSLLAFGKTLGILTDVAILYALLMDRAKLSIKNGWKDEFGYYLYFTRVQAADYLGWSLRKTVIIFHKLIKAGLLEERKAPSTGGCLSRKRLYLHVWTLPNKNFRMEDLLAGRFPKLMEAHCSPNTGGEYYVLPKPLLENNNYRTLSMNAVLLYMMILDGISLSAKYGRMDENGLVWTSLDAEKTMEQIGCRQRTLTSAYRELEKNGLIYRERQTFSGRMKIYARDFRISPEAEETGDPSGDVSIHEPAAWGSDVEPLGKPSNPVCKNEHPHCGNICLSEASFLHPEPAISAPSSAQILHPNNHISNQLISNQLEIEKASPHRAQACAADDRILSRTEEKSVFVSSEYKGSHWEWTHYDETTELLNRHLSQEKADEAIQALDNCCDVIENDLNSQNSFFKIGTEIVPRAELLLRYQHLDAVILYILTQKIAEFHAAIKNKERYVRAVLYRAVKQHSSFAWRLRREWGYSADGCMETSFA